MNPQQELFPTPAQRARHAQEIAALVPIARSLAIEAGPDGITAENIRRAGQRAGILTGQERGRTLSYLPAVFKAAGLVRVNRFRPSGIDKSHGRLLRIWCHPNHVTG